MATMVEELNTLGKEIEVAKKSVSQLEGRKLEIMERLHKDFSCKTIEEAEKLLDIMGKDIELMDASITKDFTKLKAEFSW